MADDALLLGFVLAFFSMTMILMIMMVSVIRRRRNKNKVWAEIDMNDNRTRRRLALPDEYGKLHLFGGAYDTGGAATLYNAAWITPDWKPLYRYTQGDPRPLRVSKRFGVSANPGKPVQLTYLGHQVVPAETTEIFMKNKLAADIYANKNLLLVIAVIVLVLVFVAVLGLYAKGTP